MRMYACMYLYLFIFFLQRLAVIFKSDWTRNFAKSLEQWWWCRAVETVTVTEWNVVATTDYWLKPHRHQPAPWCWSVCKRNMN